MEVEMKFGDAQCMESGMRINCPTSDNSRRRWEGQGEWCTCIEESKTDGKPEH
jgi:hypothetical protein